MFTNGVNAVRTRSFKVARSRRQPHVPSSLPTVSIEPRIPIQDASDGAAARITGSSRVGGVDAGLLPQRYGKNRRLLWF